MTYFLDSFDEDETFEGETDFLVQEDFLSLDPEIFGDRVGQDSSAFFDPELLLDQEFENLENGLKNALRGPSFSKNDNHHPRSFKKWPNSRFSKS